MGNDGGSIPTRRELVKEAAKNPNTTQLKEKQHEQQEYYWSTDPLSRKPLARPIVSDSNGKLYNKDSILEHLIASASEEVLNPEADTILQGAVSSLKDVIELQFTVDESNESGSNGGAREAWLCPVTNEALGPGSKAAYLVPCGHVFSGAAIKEVAGEKCVVCETAYAENDVVPIVPTATEDIARLAVRAKRLKEQGLSHSLKKAGKREKKSKKRSREAVEDGVPETNGADTKTTKGGTAKQNGHAKEVKEAKETNGGINNSTTKALTAKVLAEEEKRKKIKMGNENIKSLFSSRDQSKPIGKSSDFMTRGFEIPASAKR